MLALSENHQIARVVEECVLLLGVVVLSRVASYLVLNDMVKILEIKLVSDGFTLVCSLDGVLCIIRVHEFLTILVSAAIVIVDTLLVVLSQE